jgi:hypothetical protein
MAINATAVWRVRAGGSDTNGAGYDSAISGAGTDYSQQDAAQLSLTDIACSATTTVTSATGGFTAAMIGNSIRITGGGATSGYYYITGHTNTNTITVDRTPGTVTNGTGKVGGAAATHQVILNSANGTGDKCVAGNTVWIRGAGSENPSSPDYTFTGHVNVVIGDTTNGRVFIKGENGRPLLQGNGLILNLCTYIWLENISATTSGNTNGQHGHFRFSGTGNVAINVKTNSNNQTVMHGFSLAARSKLLGCELYGGTTSPSFSSGSHGVIVASLTADIIGCYIHHFRDRGISAGDTSTDTPKIVGNVIYANAGDGIRYRSESSTVGMVSGNTIDGNGGHGISVVNTDTIGQLSIFNNLITNHTGSSKYGIHLEAGTASLNDKVKAFCDYNGFYNNSNGNTNAISQGSNSVSLSADPYTNAASGDWTLNNTAGGGADCRDAGFPQTLPGTSTDAYTPIGILGTPAAGGGTFINRGVLTGGRL